MAAQNKAEAAFWFRVSGSSFSLDVSTERS